ncbi:hypothetical protein QL285_057410 [Trifolium repens]|nr:hypothetical protein QL285_057410 [Trifolium repens]
MWKRWLRFNLDGRDDYDRMLKVEVQFRFRRFVEGLPRLPQLLIQRVTNYATVSFEKMTGISQQDLEDAVADDVLKARILFGFLNECFC